MTTHFTQPLSTRLDQPLACPLLPVGYPLLPSAGDGVLLNHGTETGAMFSGATAAHFDRATDEARELMARATALAVEHAPEIKKKAQLATSKAGAIANMALGKAGATTRMAGDALADPRKVRAIVTTHKRSLVIAAIAIAATVGSGLLFAKYEATATARDRIDAFLIRKNLRDRVTYQNISASPFGSVTIALVEIRISPTVTLKIGSVGISDLGLKGEQLQRIRLVVNHADVPVLALARQWGRTQGLYDAVALGYTTLNGDVELALDYDDEKYMLTLDTSGDFHDAGSWKFMAKLEGVDPSLMNMLYSLPALAAGDGFALFASMLQSVGAFPALALSEASLTLDNTGIHHRQQEIVAVDVPSDVPSPMTRDPGFDEIALVRAGMTPSVAKTSAAAYAAWLKDGGRLRVTTGLDHPLPLVKRGNLFSPFVPNVDSVAGFVAATKSQISN